MTRDEKIENVRAFREALGALYAKHGLRVTSCGCCSDWIEPLRSYEDGKTEADSLEVAGDEYEAEATP